MLHFCTLFDKNYLSRGLVMYQSLIRNCSDCRVFIIAFDDQSELVLRKMNLEKVTVVSLNEFEDTELLAVKPTRSKAEYCWTCTPSVILFCIRKFNLPSCVYVDADLFFYQSPQALLDEIPQSHHVMITAHRYSWYYDRSNASGKYCVQFMYFDSSQPAMDVLTTWRNQCLEWCYNRIEDGKFGDQKYLDDWTTRYRHVWELQHPGGGLAPWNIQQYRFENNSEGTEIKTRKKFIPVFYHFHGVKFYQHGKLILFPNTYHISKQVKSVFYDPYIEQLQKAKDLIRNFDAGIDPHGSRPASCYFAEKYIHGIVSYFYLNYVKRIFKSNG